MSGMQQLLMKAAHFTVNMPATITEDTGGSVAFNADGSITIFASPSGTTTDYWGRSPVADIGANFWIRATIVGGTPGAGTMTSGTWYQLNAVRSLVASQTEGGSYAATVEIAGSNGGTALDTCTVTVSTP